MPFQPNRSKEFPGELMHQRYFVAARVLTRISLREGRYVSLTPEELEEARQYLEEKRIRSFRQSEAAYEREGSMTAEAKERRRQKCKDWWENLTDIEREAHNEKCRQAALKRYRTAP